MVQSRQRFARRIATVAGVAAVLGLAAEYAAAQAPRAEPIVSGATASPAQIAEPDEVLWQRIWRMSAPTPVDGDYQARFDKEAERRRNLLDDLRRYQLLYPGGRRATESLQMELQTLFELGCAAGGSLQALAERTEQVRANSPPATVLEEIDYWAIICQHVREHSTLRAVGGTSQPAATEPAWGASLCTGCAAGYRAYLAAHPTGRYSIRLAERLFEDAERRGDRIEMAAICAKLQPAWPQHWTTATLAGRLRRREAVGQPFQWVGTLDDGARFDVQSWRGMSGRILIWDPSDPKNADRIPKVMASAQVGSTDRWLGISLAGTVARTKTAADALALRFPQATQALGPAAEIVRDYGISRVPAVFWIDAAGRLERWNESD